MSGGAANEDFHRRIVRLLDPLKERDPRESFHMETQSASLVLEEAAPAAVLIGLVERTGGHTVLLTRRSDTLRKHTGQVALPGGRLDPGERTWEAALREAHEEIGLESDYVSLAGLATPLLTHSGYLITPVVGFIREGFELHPNPHEVAEIFETPFGFLMDQDNHKQEHVIWEGQPRSYYAMTHEDRRIWGVTAAILRSLSDRLYGATGA